MTTNVDGKVYFHINRRGEWNPAPLLTHGERIATGTGLNPLVAYYERPRTEPVRDHVTGAISRIDCIAFLKMVRDGRLHAPTLPKIACNIADHYNMLVRELIWEEIREKEFPDAPSRQRCLWLIEDEASLNLWTKKLATSQPSDWQTLRVAATGLAHIADATLLLGSSEALSTTRDKARSYWRGDMSPNPEREVIFEGEIQVVDVVQQSQQLALDAAHLH